ncbi:MAG: 50S ribosomal protein L11 methyltransferase [Alphaproteobacteria bacterium]|nr:50S ribosomal protein L11 methyltransferase [Alphaproteobacteria bacterium]
MPGEGASGDGSPRGRHFWVVRLVAGDAPAAAWQEALAPIAQSVARIKVEPTACAGARSWRIEAICDHPPVASEIAGLLAEAAGVAVAELPEIEIETLEDKDWLALNRRQFPPVRAGRFFIHGTHFDGSPPPGALAICLDAGPAFGSGTHESTRGALMAIDRCARERAYGRVLDLGCGSGILALALAAATGAAVLASDRDDVAVRNAKFNAAANGFGSRIEARLADGLSAPVRAGAPFDLVVANILAEPLIGMAADLGEVVAPGGILILSGLLTGQEDDVLAAFHAAGFSHRFTMVLGQWSTLTVRRGI